MAHIDAEIGVIPAFGWMVDKSYTVDVTPLRSGVNARNLVDPRPVRRFVLPFNNILQQDYLDNLNAIFDVAHGGWHTFNVRDYSEDIAINAVIGNAPSGSTPVQLKITKTVGGQTSVRKITRPLSSGFVLFQTGTPKAGTLDTSTGLFTPTTAWTAGQPLTWSGSFRVPVRFKNSTLPMTIDNKSAGRFVMNGSVELIEELE